MSVVAPGPGRSRNEGRDRAQLLLLAGFILVIMFVLTSLTLSKIASIEADVARDHRAPVVDEFDFIRSRTNSTMNTLVDSDTSNSSFNDSFSSLRSSFQDVENGKGYDLVLELAGSTTPAPKTEEGIYVDGSDLYQNVSFDGLRDFDGESYDGVNDGILWYQGAGDSSAHIKGFAAFIHLSDHESRIEATVLFSVNND